MRPRLATRTGPSPTDLGFTRDRTIVCASRPWPTCDGPRFARAPQGDGERGCSRLLFALLGGVFDDLAHPVDHGGRRPVQRLDQRLNLRSAGEVDVDLPLLGVGT